MKNIIKKVPIPLSGVMLGTAALGNLLQSYSEGVRYACGIVAGILLLVLLLKCCMFPQMIAEDMKNPIMASVAATFPMGISLLAAYVEPFIGGISLYIWYAAMILHLGLIGYFTWQFILKFQIKKVFTSYFIVYAGIAVTGITAPAFGKENLGAIAFWFAFICLLLLLVVIGYRYLKYREIPEPARPLGCIFAAPASLCLVAYIQSVTEKSTGLVIFMAVLACLLYLIGLVFLVKGLQLPFYPSYAAFTFPFVISAIAMKQTRAYFDNIGNPQAYLEYVVLIETIIATVLVLYTLVRYSMFLTKKA